MPQIVFLNKSDLILPEEAEAIADRITKNQESIFPHPEAISTILFGSCGSFQGVNELKNAMFELLAKHPKNEQIFQVLDDDRAYQHPDEGFVISKKKGVYHVVGDRVERMLSVTNLREPESLRHFFYVLRAMGVIESLLQQGLQVGDEVMIGKTSFSYGDEMF